MTRTEALDQVFAQMEARPWTRPDREAERLRRVIDGTASLAWACRDGFGAPPYPLGYGAFVAVVDGVIDLLCSPGVAKPWPASGDEPLWRA